MKVFLKVVKDAKKIFAVVRIAHHHVYIRANNLDLNVAMSNKDLTIAFLYLFLASHI